MTTVDIPDGWTLGRRTPESFEHVEKHPFLAGIAAVEVELALPPWEKDHNQGNYNACVGFNTSMMMSILNFYDTGVWKRYDCFWLWDRAKENDEWSDTNPGDNNGTSVNAACKVLNKIGHVRIDGAKAPPSLKEGIAAYKWAKTIDSIRNCLSVNVPISYAITWTTDWDNPVKINGEWWAGTGTEGTSRGGHDICIMAASDRRQAIGFTNSWPGYPPVTWVPYARAEQKLLANGEACLVTDLATGQENVNPASVIQDSEFVL